VATATSAPNNIMYSKDGKSWTTWDAPSANSWSAVTYGKERFLAVSTNGTNQVMVAQLQMELVNNSPSANATAIAVNANIVLTFDATLDNTTVNSTNIVVRGQQSGSIAGNNRVQ